MPLSDGILSSPPGPSTSSADAIAYYKAQYELLEAELAEFQTSSKELEAELEKDIEASEKRERHLKEKAGNLGYEVDEWKAKYKQSKAEANAAQHALQKEVTTLRDANRTLQMSLRDTEVANDDYERQQRNTESSLEDLESKYSMAIERSVMMEEQIKIGEQEREALRIETQRLRDELSDLRIEADIIKTKWNQAEASANRRHRLSLLESVAPSASPRSELSPATSDSTPSFDTPPGKTASSSGLSDTHTPPSPPTSERSTNAPKAFKTPNLPKTRLSLISNNTTPRPSTHTLKPPTHSRGPSVPAPSGRSTPSTTNFRQSLTRPSTASLRGGVGGLAQSNSIHHLHNLQGKMQRLTERVHTAKSKLPGPVNTPPKSSPRSNAASTANIPASVTVRSGRRRPNGGSTSSRINGAESVPEVERAKDGTGTPSSSSPSVSSLKPNPSRQFLTTTSMRPPLATPTRIVNNNTATNISPDRFVRPSSRASATSTSARDPYHSYQAGHGHSHSHSHSQGQPDHIPSRPGSRTSISSTSMRPPLSKRPSQHFSAKPNASTDRVRPKSSLSSYGYDGAMDLEDVDPTVTPTAGENEVAGEVEDVMTPTPARRMSVLSNNNKARIGNNNNRASDVGVPTPSQAGKGKRISISSRLPAPAAAGGRQSLGFCASRPSTVSRPSMSGSRASMSSDFRPGSSGSCSGSLGAGLQKYENGCDGGGDEDEMF